MKLKFYFAFVLAAAVFGGQVFADEADATKAAPTEKTEKKTEKKADKKEKAEKKSKKKMTDEEYLTEQSTKIFEALKANDTEKVMAYFSDDFTSPQFKDKAALKGMIELGVNMGIFADLKEDKSEMKYDIKSEKATVGPWKFEASGQSGSAMFHCTKKSGEWKIYGLELDGIYF